MQLKEFLKQAGTEKNLMELILFLSTQVYLVRKGFLTTVKKIPVEEQTVNTFGEEQMALDIYADAVFISMLNKDACASVRMKLEALNVRARVVTAPELRQTFDLRLAVLKMIAGEVRERNIGGSLAELGVYRGAFAAEMNRLFPDRSLYLFDTFSGFDLRDVAVEGERKFSRAETGNFADTSVEAVRERLPFPDMAVFKAGYFPETAAGIDDTFAVVSLDADLYKPLYDGLCFFYPLMARGGYIIIHDYNNSRFAGAKQAVREFCEENQVFVIPLPDLHGTGVIVRP